MKQSTARILIVTYLGSFAATLLSCGVGRADTLIYLSASGSGEGAMPIAPQETLKFLPSGGSFHIWVQPDALLNGISLDVDATGSAIRFTGSTVHNPAVGSDTRWLPSLVRQGDYSDDKVSRIEGGALAPLSGFGSGIGPGTSSSDALYESGGGFLFAMIDFEVAVPTAMSSVSLSIGHNLVSDTMGVATTSLLLGVADGPVANTAGATGSVVDLNLVGAPLHPSDFDADGDVDGQDLLTWQDGFGLTSGATRSQGDADGDAAVDGDDLAIWQTQYGTVPAGPTVAPVAIPEATTLSLLVCGMVVSLAKRGRVSLHS